MHFWRVMCNYLVRIAEMTVVAVTVRQPHVAKPQTVKLIESYRR